MATERFYDQHIFVCENHRGEGERPSCGVHNSEILKHLKQKPKTSKVRVQRAGCLDRCEEGPILVSYPEGKWFSLKTKEDADRFYEKYIRDNDFESVADLAVTQS
ncbi:(2Fe-2S) ferredoxin domain-containing protein [Leptospira sp. GIMC2001]|uniref:(2Fe-2S) ferredoxin domain-containing protein n=1 Tax=Leptospira sp. GIMC2001 TaxID=1513297 RepID=UPI0023493C22|nr:(2Fe-2S) ferredoxin domain-containing protein [Leptospira sp. GIMC2001]WCL49680.1 (2Fe-2S) ferredoxin domain-containing protein [Leptospira sp. GIMC2001]